MTKFGTGIILKTCVVILFCSITTVEAATYSGVMDNRVDFPKISGFTAQAPAWFGGTTPGKGFRLEWTVDDTTTQGYWTYNYRLIRGISLNKAMAFFDIEVSEDFTAANVHSWRAVSAINRNGNPISSGLSSITISEPTNFATIHDFTGDRATPGYNYLSKFDLSHYSGDPGISSAGLPGGVGSATPTAGPVPHPFFGLRWTFPGTGFDSYETCAWEVELVTDRAPMWGDFFLWGDQTSQLPKWYANAYNDQIDNPLREQAPPSDNLNAEYPGWLLVPGPETVKILLGDVNQDGIVNVFDALAVLRYSVGLPGTSGGSDSFNVAVADVAPLEQTSHKPKGDGHVDVFDALGILRHAVGLDSW